MAIEAQGLEIQIGARTLLHPTNFHVAKGDKIGLVGRNGAGKTTLTRVITGDMLPTAGKVRVSGKLGYLPQDTHAADPEQTALDRMMSARDIASIIKRIRKAEKEMTDPDPDVMTKAMNRYDKAMQDFEKAGGYAAQSEATAMAASLGLPQEVMGQQLGTLSGGQRRRIELARILFSDADTLILDEPTNHIDLDMAQWLEDRLLKYRGTLIVVTHDRYLLERAFSRIFEVGDGKVEIYNTTYSGYLEERAQREEMEAATLRKNKSLYRKELAWIRRGAPARSTKAKGRIQRFDAVAEAIKEAPPEAELTMKSVASRLGKKILSWENLSIGYGENTLVRDFSYTLLRDDRLGIIGGNGAGKTTLLRTLCGELPPLSGVIEKGDTVRIGYFAQHCPALDPDTRIIDAVKDVAVHVYTPDGDLSASQMAETFLFPSQMQYQKVSSLSLIHI